MPRRPYRPPELLRRPFLGSTAVSEGLITYDQLRGKSWRQVAYDVYVDASIPDSHKVRCQGIGLILPSGAAITGRSAACLDGLPLSELDDPVHVLARPKIRVRRRGCRLVRTRWLPDAHVRPGDLPVTVHPRTAWEIASEPDLVEAVAALDLLFRARQPRREVMESWVAKFPDSRAARAIDLSDERAESPQESRARIRIRLAGFPPPVPQYNLRMNGHFVARFDLAWPDAKVAVEYDGWWHAGAQQLSLDRARLTGIVDAGWRVYYLTSVDLKDPVRFELFCGRLRRALL